MEVPVHSPIDIADNLNPDGSNYIEWVWSLLDDGIDVRPSRSFSDLLAEDGSVLLDRPDARHLDTQLVLASAAATARGHRLNDVVTCCQGSLADSTKLADELNREYFANPVAAVARARAIAEICEIAEEYCQEAIQLKWKLAGDDQLALPVRAEFQEPS